MEYRIEASAVLDPGYVAGLIMAWYRGPTARQINPVTAFRPHTGQVPGNSSSQRFGAFTSGPNVRPGALTGATAAERASASLAQRHPIQETTNTFPVATQPAVTQSETNFSIGSGVRLRKISSLGDFHNDYFFWGENQVLVLDRLSGRFQWVQLKAGWNNSQAANPQVNSLGRFRADGSMVVPVDQMTDVEKLAEATRRAIPGIVERGGETVQEYIESLLEPDTIAQMLVLTSVSVVFPVVGIGFAIVGVYYLGEDAVIVLENLVSFVRKAKAAQTDADLYEAAYHFEIAVVKSGGVAWNLLLKKKRQTRQLVRAERNSGSRATRVTSRSFQEIGKPVRPRQVSAVPPPQLPNICSSVRTATAGKTKKERYDARMTVIAAARKQPNLTVVTDRFELNNRAIERARLSQNIYNLRKKKEYIEPKREELRRKKLLRQMVEEKPFLFLPGQLDVINEDIAQLEKDIAKYPDEDKLTPPDGWEVMEESPEDEVPVYVVYRSTCENPAKPVLVFRGTDNDVSFREDWMTNIAQGVGLETEQYTGSIDKAQDMQNRYKKLGGFEIAGHSKGGGQAAVAGIISGAKTYTFNAAGVHHRTMERVLKSGTLADAEKSGPDGKPLVDAFNFPHEILSYLQDDVAPVIKGGLLGSGNIPLTLLGAALTIDDALSGAVGRRHTVPAQDINGNLVDAPGLLDMGARTDYHGMSYLIDSMEKQKQDDFYALANQLGCY